MIYWSVTLWHGREKENNIREALPKVNDYMTHKLIFFVVGQVVDREVDAEALSFLYSRSGVDCKEWNALTEIWKESARYAYAPKAHNFLFLPQSSMFLDCGNGGRENTRSVPLGLESYRRERKAGRVSVGSLLRLSQAAKTSSSISHRPTYTKNKRKLAC